MDTCRDPIAVLLLVREIIAIAFIKISSTELNYVNSIYLLNVVNLQWRILSQYRCAKNF